MTADDTFASALWLDHPVQLSADGRRAVFTVLGTQEAGTWIVRADFPT